MSKRDIVVEESKPDVIKETEENVYIIEDQKLDNKTPRVNGFQRPFHPK
jgi:hypothetical protein